MLVVRQTETFRTWLDSLRDVRGQVRIAARVRQIETGNLGDWKQVKGNVGELRVDFGPGYRLYFTRRAGIVIVLLAGGVKASQARDIRRALKIEAQLGEVT